MPVLCFCPRGTRRCFLTWFQTVCEAISVLIEHVWNRWTDSVTDMKSNICCHLQQKVRRFNKIELQSHLLGTNVLLSVVKRAIWTCREQWWVKGDVRFHPACLQTGRCFNQDAHWTLKQHQLGERSAFGRFFAILREELKTCHPIWFMRMVYMYLPRYSNLKLHGWTDGEIATKMWILTPKEIRQTQLSPCALLE